MRTTNSLLSDEDQFVALTAARLAGARSSKQEEGPLIEASDLSSKIEATLSRLEGTQIRDLEQRDAEIQETSRGMAIFFVIFAVLALAATWFGRALQEHVWELFDQMRQMVGDVRCGNHSVTGEIPPSVELGSLVGAFLSMASELREMRDFPEQKVVERTATLPVAQSELLQSARLALLGQLVSAVAREINNPLASILGFSEIALGRPVADTALCGALRTIREESLRLRNLVANLSSFARRAPHRTQRFDLRGILDRLKDLREYQLLANNLSLHIDQPPDPVWVVADSDQLLQVVLNLVLNAEWAVKERRERGHAWLGCRRQGTVASIRVRDNGPGMPPEICEHIFEPFFTTWSPGNGTGLGLNISHGIISLHRGEISVESKPGEGTTRRITLPLAPIEPGPQHVWSEPPRAAKPKKPAVTLALGIDDEEDLLDLVTQALRPMKCSVTPLHGSAGVEAALDNADFDLVICDLKTPGKNGLEIYRLIRKKRPELAEHFLLMTGNMADADRHAAEFEAFPLLPKPFTRDRLRETAQQILAKGTPA